MVWRKAFSENIGSYPYYGPGIELGIDRGLGMVAHDQAGKLKAGIFKSFGAVVPSGCLELSDVESSTVPKVRACKILCAASQASRWLSASGMPPSDNDAVAAIVFAAS